MATGLSACSAQAGWSERVAVLGRSYLVVADAFRYIQPVMRLQDKVYLRSDTKGA